MIDLSFIRAGRAVFTVSNDKGDHYTYKVNKGKNTQMLFVSLLTGPNNTKDYTYMGVLGKVLRMTKASKYKVDSMPVKVFNWTIKVISGEVPMPSSYKIQHEGMCGRCGRELTHPDSIQSGLGPICKNK